MIFALIVLYVSGVIFGCLHVNNLMREDPSPNSWEHAFMIALAFIWPITVVAWVLILAVVWIAMQVGKLMQATE